MPTGVLPNHGEYRRYNRGCRCDECKSANAVYQRRRRQQTQQVQRDEERERERIAGVRQREQEAQEDSSRARTIDAERAATDAVFQRTIDEAHATLLDATTTYQRLQATRDAATQRIGEVEYREPRFDDQYMNARARLDAQQQLIATLPRGRAMLERESERVAAELSDDARWAREGMDAFYLLLDHRNALAAILDRLGDA